MDLRRAHLAGGQNLGKRRSRRPTFSRTEEQEHLQYDRKEMGGEERAQVYVSEGP